MYYAELNVPKNHVYLFKPQVKFTVLRGEQNGNTSGEQNGTPCKPMDPCKHWL